MSLVYAAPNIIQTSSSISMSRQYNYYLTVYSLITIILFLFLLIDSCTSTNNNMSVLSADQTTPTIIQHSLLLYLNIYNYVFVNITINLNSSL